MVSVLPSTSRLSVRRLLTVDAVNVLKGLLWNDKSEFDESKDKTQFRQYEEACDRVKAFYKEQHGERSLGPAGDVPHQFDCHQRSRPWHSTSNAESTSKASGGLA